MLIELAQSCASAVEDVAQQQEVLREAIHAPARGVFITAGASVWQGQQDWVR